MRETGLLQIKLNYEWSSRIIVTSYLVEIDYNYKIIRNMPLKFGLRFWYGVWKKNPLIFIII